MEGKTIDRKLQNQMNQTDEETKDRILQDFNTFKEFLGTNIEKGERMGLSEEMIVKFAEKISDYLQKNEEPRNSEEKLLQEMWKVANDEQRHQLAHILVSLAKSDTTV